MEQDSKNPPTDPTNDQCSSEKEFKKILEAKGRVWRAAEPVPKPDGEFTPVVVEGKPLSKTVIEDRG